MVNLPMMPLQEKTIFFSLAMQMYMSKEIKQPVIQAFNTIFDPKIPRLQRLRAIKRLWDALESLKGLPEPTKENTWHPNTHNLIELRDWIVGKCSLSPSRMNLIRRVMNFVIVLYDFDPPWRWIFDSLRDEALKKEWKPRGFEDTWTKTYAWWVD